MVNHFTDERWADYVRGLSPANEAAAIEQHLDEGCDECNRLFRLWRAVTEHASGEAGYQVDDDVVRTMQAAFCDWRRRHLLPRRARMARLVFDSLLEPLPSGVRGDSRPQRRLVRRTGQWLVDLRLEPETDTRISLVGQVLQSGKAPRMGLAVLLMTGDTLLGETSANRFGEFQLEFDQTRELRVYIDIPGQRPIGVTLPDADDFGASA